MKDLFEKKTLYCPVCGEELFPRMRLGGLSKRERIYYFKCEGCGLRTGKRLTMDEAVRAAQPTETAKAIISPEAPEGTPFHPLDGGELVRCSAQARDIEHRILLLREKHGDEPGFQLIFKRRMEEEEAENGGRMRDVSWEAVYYSAESGRVMWEDESLAEMLMKMDASVREWEEE